MKKIIAVVLALLLTVSLGATAFAVNEDVEGELVALLKERVLVGALAVELHVLADHSVDPGERSLRKIFFEEAV